MTGSLLVSIIIIMGGLQSPRPLHRCTGTCSFYNADQNRSVNKGIP
jgi:hypothetical protein